MIENLEDVFSISMKPSLNSVYTISPFMLSIFNTTVHSADFSITLKVRFVNYFILFPFFFVKARGLEHLTKSKICHSTPSIVKSPGTLG